MNLFKKILIFSLILSCISTSGVDSSAKINSSLYEIKSDKFDTEKVVKYDFAGISYANLINREINVNVDQLIELLDNGVTLFFYGTNLSLEPIQSLFGDNNFEIVLDEQSQKSISAIYVTNINGIRSYGGIIDASEHYLTDKKTNERIKVKDAAKRDNKTMKEHNPLAFLPEIKEDLLESKKNKGNEQNNDIIKTQMPASGWDKIVFNWYHDFNPYGEMKAPVYVYSHGYSSGDYYGDLITSMTASANSGYAVVGFKTKLYANWSDQQLVDWVDLPSKTDSISVGLSGEVPGISYSTSTEGVDVDPTVSFSGKYAEWDCNSRPLFLAQIDGEAFKIEPAIRVSSDDNRLDFRRYYLMDIEDVFWGTSYVTDYMYSTTYVTLN